MEKFKKCMDIIMCILKFLLKYSIPILTLGLLITTLLYLIETSRIRKIAEKSLHYETCPKIFISNIVSKPSFIESQKRIEITAIVQITNIGKIEAKNVILNYNLSSGKIQIKDKIGPIPYIFPSQKMQYGTKVLNLNLDEKGVMIVKECLKEKKPVSIEGDLANPIILEINIKYEGLEEDIQYKFKYEIKINKWVYLSNE